MSASVFLVRPQAEGAMAASDYESQPGFENDCQAWAAFFVQVDEDAQLRALLTAADVAPLLSLTTAGLSDGEVTWTRPAALSAAARRLRSLVEAQAESVEPIVSSYDEGANHLDDVRVEFITDLRDLAVAADWAATRGWQRVAIEVSW